MAAEWIFPETTPYQVQGRDLSEDNFAQEDRNSQEILIREALQNPLDARAPDNAGPVRVRISILQPGQYDEGYLSNLLKGEYENRLKASGNDPLPDFSTASVLVLEDFGTTGLEGSWDNPNADGPSENWNAFWLREGEGAKATTGSNGRAGQGKITYYRVGAARAVFGFTVRQSDKKLLLMGRSAFRKVYPYNGSKYLRHSFWCTDHGQPLPVTDVDEITNFRDSFKLERLSEPGLSLVIPCPIGFDPQAAVLTTISEFYYPIACGKLNVSINEQKISAANIDSVANELLPDEIARQKKSSFTKGFRMLVRNVIEADKSGSEPIKLELGWDTSSSINETSLPKGSLQKLRTAMEQGELISIRCPVRVSSKNDTVSLSWFDVHLEVPDDLEHMEEAYIRRDLLIGSENHLAPSAYLQKARGLTLIHEDALSAFLADAEEPTHLKWNGSRPRLSEDYSNPQATLRAVRNAAPRLLALISNGIVKRDIKALAKYFNRPADAGTLHATGATNPGQKDTAGGHLPPPPMRKPFRIETGMDRVHVLPNGSAAPKQEDLPMTCALELAYEGLDQDSFKAYDPFDFDLEDTESHKISVSGACVTVRRGNQIHFIVTDPEFHLEADGFDPNIRLHARLNYPETSNGTAISEK